MEYPSKIVPNPRPLFYFKKRNLNYYSDILEIADTNVHEQVTNVINKMYPEQPIHILDVACGKCALSLRIKDSRVKKQLDDEIITLDQMNPVEPVKFPYYQMDLNNEEQLEDLVNEYRNYFDIILGIEIIEHLENPKKCLYYLKEMLNDEGHLLISTPNVNNPMARRIFYKKGRLEQFSEKDLQYGHISIILPHILENIATSLTLKIMVEYPVGLYPKFWLYPNIRSLYITFCNILLPMVKGSWCKLYIFKKDINER